MDIKLRARRAQQILGDSVFKEAVEAIDQEILREFRACKANDPERLTAIKGMQDTLVRFVEYFERAMRTGQMEEGKLINIEKARKWHQKILRH